MGKRVSSHRLDNVELRERTAECLICGPTQVVVRGDSKRPDLAPSIMCINRSREIVRDSQRRRRALERTQNPNWKPKHSLSEIDPKKMRAVCAVCGPTDILKATTFKNQTFYRCATIVRQNARDYSRLQYHPKS
jgi:hypothetical protein